MKKRLFLFEKLVLSLDSKLKPFVNLLINKHCHATKHLPDSVCLIDLVWKRCAILLLLTLKFPKIKQTLFTLEFHPKNKWTTFLDKLVTSSVSDQNTLYIHLFQTLLVELTSKEKDYQPFWTPAYKDLSERLLLPIKIDSADSVLTFSNLLYPNVEVKSSFLTIKEIEVQNKNSQKTYFQLSTSTVVDKWVNEVTDQNVTKALKVKLKPCYQQRKILDKWINTSNYVYNKTIESINNGDKINFMSLRDKLVTKSTKKEHVKYKEITSEIDKLKEKRRKMSKEHLCTDDVSILITKKKLELRNVAKQLAKEHNVNVKEWECETPKEVRAGAINDVCKAYKTGFSNLKAGNINHFRLGFRKHYSTAKSVVIPKSFVSVRNGRIRIAPDFFKDKCEFRIGERTLKKHKLLSVNNDCRIIKKNGDYWIVVPVTMDVNKRKDPVNYCGIDPGSRTFMTSFGNVGCKEYKHDQMLLDKLNRRISMLKSLRTRPRKHEERNRYRKRVISKVEERKSNLVDELHWKTIIHLLNNNDFVFYGNIKSHGIVKNGVNKHLNRNLNDLKLYKFKERLLYKAKVLGKQVFTINESYTTQTCSCCGSMYKPGSSEVYNCSNCSRVMGRDVNASKNILMKGIVGNLL